METCKTCTRCQLSLAVSEFSKGAKHKDGYMYQCKACCKKQNDKNFDRYNIARYKYTRNSMTRFAKVARVCKAVGREFSITFAQYEEFLKRPCQYCKGPLNETGSNLDRVDSTKGYVEGNVVTCCAICNSIKNIHTPEFLLQHIPKFLEGVQNLLKERKK